MRRLHLPRHGAASTQLSAVSPGEILPRLGRERLEQVVRQRGCVREASPRSGAAAQRMAVSGGPQGLPGKDELGGIRDRGSPERFAAIIGERRKIRNFQRSARAT